MDYLCQFTRVDLDETELFFIIFELLIHGQNGVIDRNDKLHIKYCLEDVFKVP